MWIVQLNFVLGLYFNNCKGVHKHERLWFVTKAFFYLHKSYLYLQIAVSFDLYQEIF